MEGTQFLPQQSLWKKSRYPTGLWLSLQGSWTQAMPYFCEDWKVVWLDPQCGWCGIPNHRKMGFRAGKNLKCTSGSGLSLASTPTLSLLQTSVSVSSAQLLSRVQLFATPWTTACQASLSITNSWSPSKPMSIESVMPSSHLILVGPSPPALNLSEHQGLFGILLLSLWYSECWQFDLWFLCLS